MINFVLLGKILADDLAEAIDPIYRGSAEGWIEGFQLNWSATWGGPHDGIGLASRIGGATDDDSLLIDRSGVNAVSPESPEELDLAAGALIKAHARGVCVAVADGLAGIVHRFTLRINGVGDRSEDGHAAPPHPVHHLPDGAIAGYCGADNAAGVIDPIADAVVPPVDGAKIAWRGHAG